MSSIQPIGPLHNLSLFQSPLRANTQSSPYETPQRGEHPKTPFDGILTKLITANYALEARKQALTELRNLKNNITKVCFESQISSPKAMLHEDNRITQLIAKLQNFTAPQKEVSLEPSSKELSESFQPKIIDFSSAPSEQSPLPKESLAIKEQSSPQKNLEEEREEEGECSQPGSPEFFLKKTENSPIKSDFSPINLDNSPIKSLEISPKKLGAQEGEWGEDEESDLKELSSLNLTPSSARKNLLTAFSLDSFNKLEENAHNGESDCKEQDSLNAIVPSTFSPISPLPNIDLLAQRRKAASRSLSVSASKSRPTSSVSITPTAGRNKNLSKPTKKHSKSLSLSNRKQLLETQLEKQKLVNDIQTLQDLVKNIKNVNKEHCEKILNSVSKPAITQVLTPNQMNRLQSEKEIPLEIFNLLKGRRNSSWTPVSKDLQ